jgi:hypothetical protein
MSRRFGRNQRRRMRETIANGADQIRRLSSVASERYRDMIKERTRRAMVERELVDWAARILTVAGPNSAFARHISTEGVDAGVFEAVALRGGSYQLSPIEPITLLGPTRERAMLGAARTVVEAFALLADLDADQLSHRVRFQISGPDGATALLLDQTTLHRLRAGRNAELAVYLLDRLIKPYLREEG